MHFDGLRRVDGPSALGDFHYVPVIFAEPRRIRKPQRLLLEVSPFYSLLCRARSQGPASCITARLQNDDRALRNSSDAG